MQEDYQTVGMAVRRMADGKLRCPQCGGELLLVEQGLLCVDGECDQVYDIPDGKPIFFVIEESTTGKKPLAH